VSRYGFIPSPAVAINGQVRVAGRIPSLGEITKMIRETAWSHQDRMSDNEL